MQYSCFGDTSEQTDGCFHTGCFADAPDEMLAELIQNSRDAGEANREANEDANALDSGAVSGSDADEALHELIRRYRGLSLQFARQYAATEEDAEEYAQDGLLGVVTAAYLYSCDRGAGFRTFAAVCIRSRVRSSARLAFSGNAGASARLIALPLDDLENSAQAQSGIAEALSSGQRTPEQVVLERERLSEIYAWLRTFLSRQELEIFLLSLSNCPYAEIAQELRISEKSVDNAIQRARRKIRAVRSKTDSRAEGHRTARKRPPQSG